MASSKNQKNDLTKIFNSLGPNILALHSESKLEICGAICLPCYGRQCSLGTLRAKCGGFWKQLHLPEQREEL